jgi:hypothetical protein
MDKLKALTKHWKLMVIIVFGIALLGAIFYMGWNKFNEQRPIATVGDKEIKMVDLKAKIWEMDFGGSKSNPSRIITDIEKDDILNRLIESEIIKEEAVKLGISTNKEEIQARVNLDLDHYGQLGSEEKKVALKNTETLILKEKIIKEVVGWKEGVALLSYFDQEESMIEERKVYGKELLAEIAADLKVGKISEEEAVFRLEQDPRVGFPSFDPYSPRVAFVFDREMWQKDSLLNNISVKDGVLNTEANNYSQVIELENLNVLVWINYSNTGEGRAKSYKEWINQKMIEYKVKISSPVNYFSLLRNSSKELLNQKAVAAGTCGGGLVYSHDHQPAGLALTFLQKSAGDPDPYKLTQATAEAKFDPNSGNYSFFEYHCRTGGTINDPIWSHSQNIVCKDGAVYNLKDGLKACGNYTNVSEYDFDRYKPYPLLKTTGEISANANGEINYGMPKCGANAYFGFSCRCSQKSTHYIFTVKYTGSGAGEWKTATYKSNTIKNLSVKNISGNRATINVEFTGTNGATPTLDIVWQNKDVSVSYPYEVQMKNISPSGPVPSFSYSALVENLNCNSGDFSSPMTLPKSGSSKKVGGCSVNFKPNALLTLPPGWTFEKMTVSYTNKPSAYLEDTQNLLVGFNEDNFPLIGSSKGEAVIIYYFKHTATEITSEWGNMNIDCRLVPDTLSGTYPLKVTLKCDNFVLTYPGADLPNSSGEREKILGVVKSCYESGCCSEDKDGFCTSSGCCISSSCSYDEWWKYQDNGRSGSPVYRPKLTQLLLEINWDSLNDPSWSNPTKINLLGSDYLNISGSWETRTVNIDKFNFVHHYNKAGDYKIKARVKASASWQRQSIRKNITSSCCSCPFTSVTESKDYGVTEFQCNFKNPNGPGTVPTIDISVTAWNNPNSFEPAP